ncbi:MAG: hypothetical protein KatS3mg076_2281 [Candidatus Binatia bacterium]|nr:MAG: hypothetical protein KatS3mg076_2281 [Candidatus Binatia bacterium]
MWSDPDGGTTVRVDEDTVRVLRETHLRRTGEWPSRERLRDLVRNWVEEEMLYREALALGLDRDDPVVRRRLVQKMEFLVDAEVDRLPTRAELERYFRSRRSAYRQPDRVSFVQVFLGDEGRAAGAVLRALRAGERPESLGLPFLLGSRFEKRSAEEIASLFGEAFARAVRSAPVGRWTGPLRSRHGFHVLRVLSRERGRTPEFEEIRERLVQDWLEERRRDARRKALAKLASRYRVVFPESLGE